MRHKNRFYSASKIAIIAFETRLSELSEHDYITYREHREQQFYSSLYPVLYHSIASYSIMKQHLCDWSLEADVFRTHSLMASSLPFIRSLTVPCRQRPTPNAIYTMYSHQPMPFFVVGSFLNPSRTCPPVHRSYPSYVREVASVGHRPLLTTLHPSLPPSP